MIGAVRGIDPETGFYYDDTKRYIEASTILSAQDKPQDLRRQRAARVPAPRCGAESEGQVNMSRPDEQPRHRQAQHRARRRGGGREAVALRRRHHPRGDGPRRPDEALHAADLRRRPAVRHRGHRAAAARRQLDDARRGRAAAAGRRGGRGLHRREHRRLLRRSAGDQLSRARRQGARHRRRRARREGSDRDAVPGVLAGDQRQGHGQGHARAR